MKLIKGVGFLFLFGLFILFLRSGSFRTPEIYDCFLFYNEVDLLELRLEEMAGSVDKFVIVEAAETFRGNPKPLNFPEHRERFQKFKDKIIYVPVEGHFETSNPWERERYQRDQILQGLKKCKRSDIILISDVDEIVRKEKMPEIVAPLIGKSAEAVVLTQKMYFGYVNRYQGTWNGTVATTYEQVKRLSPKIVRKLRHMKPKRIRTSHISKMISIKDSGWHFSSLGGVNQYIDKIRSFSHAELDTEEFTRKENLIQVLKSCPLVPIDESFPLFLREQHSYFRQIGFID